MWGWGSSPLWVLSWVRKWQKIDCSHLELRLDVLGVELKLNRTAGARARTLHRITQMSQMQAGAHVHTHHTQKHACTPLPLASTYRNLHTSQQEGDKKGARPQPPAHLLLKLVATRPRLHQHIRQQLSARVSLLSQQVHLIHQRVLLRGLPPATARVAACGGSQTKAIVWFD